jgi:hypothetical protein
VALNFLINLPWLRPDPTATVDHAIWHYVQRTVVIKRGKGGLEELETAIRQKPDGNMLVSEKKNH